ncbi:MAG TPA: hypothetical protein VH575_10655 [Gemmataceae bacterium]|jgi:uncharacterized protein (UPF0332 family)
MDETGFLNVADVLSRGDTEAEWRSAISRAYYAAFHKARRLLWQGGFAVPAADTAHAYLWLRLSNCKHPDIIELGHKLGHLRGMRNRADYNMDVPVDQAAAFDHVQVAADNHSTPRRSRQGNGNPRPRPRCH